MFLALGITLSCLTPIISPSPAMAQTVQDAGYVADDTQQPVEAAPLNPDFVAYQQYRSASGPVLLRSMAMTEQMDGLVPAPVDRSYLKGQNLVFSGEGKIELPATYGPTDLDILGDGAGFPQSYDLRTSGKVTGVRNQGSSGCCWAFATYSSLESYLMPAEPRDFSENNLKNTHGFDIGPNSGGNEQMSTAYLTRWSGPANETSDPYVAISTSSPVLPSQMHVQEVLFIPDRANSTDNDNLKQAIQTYGAVYTTCYWGASYYNAASHSYYYASTGSNHAVALVGWDDSYSRNNFASTPPGDGAFVARNSWGSGWGDGGYFYISYYDRIAGTSNVVFTAQPASNYDRIYQHDPLGWTGNRGYGSDVAWFAANYTAISNETLSAVGFYTPQVNSDYQVYIYTGNTLNGPGSGTFALPGYHTVSLAAPVTLIAGQQFRVAVRLHTPSYNYPVCTESRYEDYTSGATSNASESFISSNGVAWLDIGADSHGNPTGTDVCLKAYTTTTGTGLQPPVPPGWPLLEFGGQFYNVSENAGNARITVSRNGSTTLPSSVSYSVTGGNATAGTDYTGGSGTLSFAAGAASATFNVAIVNDASYEGNETVAISLGNPVNASLGALSSTTIVITDNDARPVLGFGAGPYSASEGAGKITIAVNLAGNTAVPASVGYSVTGGNATGGTDYTGGSGTLSFAPGTTTATFDISLSNDAVYEGNETITLSLSNPVNATIGTPSGTTATIINNDASPSLQFGAAQYNGNENAGAISVQVNLAGSTSLSSSVSYSVTGGNATAGTDYTGGSGTLNFAPGVTTATFSVSIVNDAACEGNETIAITLGNPKNATLGTTTATTITIRDDDQPASPGMINISFVEGWNLISIPLTLQDNGISSIFPADVRSGIVDIWGWDEPAQNWVYYSPDPDDYFYQYYPALTGLYTGKAYWVEMNKTATLVVHGTVPASAPASPAVPVSGWNFAGPTGGVSSTPVAMYPGAVDVWGWDEPAQNWVYYSPDPDDYFYQYYPKMNSIQPGHGYWVEMA